MGFLDSAGNFFGDITGVNQANRSAEQAQAGQANQNQAAGQLGGIGGKSASQFAGEAGQAGTALADQMGRQAATSGTQQVLQGARTAGLNKGQASQEAGQAAGGLYTSGQQRGQGLGMEAYGMGANTQLGGASSLANLGSNQMGSSVDQAKLGNQASGGLLSAIGGLFSDEKVKEGIKESPKIEEVAAKVKPVAFEYKEKMGQGKGEHVGITAQDMEKTPLKENVIETPAGKMIHPGKQENSNLNLIVQLENEIKSLEAQLRGKHGNN